MGKIKVLGVAERKVECDLMVINLSFRCVSKSSKEAMSQVMKECESFLKIVKGQKIDISLCDDSLNEVELKENIKGYKAEKKLEIKGGYDATLINVIHEICLKKNFTVSMDVEMSISKENESNVRKELLEEALRRSKEEATLIMEAEGKNKIELATVNRNDRYRNLPGDCGYGGFLEGILGESLEETYAAVKTNFANSNELKAKMERIREEIEVVWKIS